MVKNATLELPENVKSGVWLHMANPRDGKGNIFLPLACFETKLTKELFDKKGNKVGGGEETPCDPFFLLADTRNPGTRVNGIRGVTGVLANLGDVYLLVNGERIDFVLLDGLTGKEGDKKRNPKKYASEADAATIGERSLRAAFLASQTNPMSLFVQASLTNTAVGASTSAVAFDLAEFGSAVIV